MAISAVRAQLRAEHTSPQRYGDLGYAASASGVSVDLDAGRWK